MFLFCFLIRKATKLAVSACIIRIQQIFNVIVWSWQILDNNNIIVLRTVVYDMIKSKHKKFSYESDQV